MIFLKHKKSLKSNFVLNEFSFLTPEEIVASIQKDIPTIPLFSKIASKSPSKGLGNSKGKQKKSKPILITEEADNFLLATIFNVKL